MISVFKINARPGRFACFVLPWVLFVVCFLLYTRASFVRHQENPRDKLVPTVTQLIDGVKRSAFEEDRKGDLRLWVDSWASTKRFFIALIIISLGILIGLNMGAFPYLELFFYRFFLFFDKVPALALLPILFITFGLGEVSKVALIVIGVMPTIVLDTFLRAKEFPRELNIKAMTLGASHFEILYRVILPNIFPKVLDTLRLNLKAVVLFLIAGESLAATAGLGYRIFVVRRYLAMDIIIPYVIWISLLAFSADFLLRYWIRHKYQWLNK
ncbi:MAG: ABC transporter permease subunit [Fibrobacteria bacterium]|nr:ABC transporter permease subunit [Fibrobacteria bacterium]